MEMQEIWHSAMPGGVVGWGGGVGGIPEPTATLSIRLPRPLPLSPAPAPAYKQTQTSPAAPCSPLLHWVRFSLGWYLQPPCCPPGCPLPPLPLPPLQDSSDPGAQAAVPLLATLAAGTTATSNSGGRGAVLAAMYGVNLVGGGRGGCVGGWVGGWGRRCRWGGGSMGNGMVKPGGCEGAVCVYVPGSHRVCLFASLRVSMQTCPILTHAASTLSPRPVLPLSHPHPPTHPTRAQLHLALTSGTQLLDNYVDLGGGAVYGQPPGGGGAAATVTLRVSRGSRVAGNRAAGGGGGGGGGGVWGGGEWGGAKGGGRGRL